MKEEKPIKVSDLIKLLQGVLNEHGDLDVCTYDDEFCRLYPLVNDGRGPELMVLPNQYRPSYGNDDWDKSKEDEYHRIEYPMCNKDCVKNLTPKVFVV